MKANGYGTGQDQLFYGCLWVWAYVSQVRMDELKANFKGDVEIDSAYFHVFGNVVRDTVC
jgi:hypothetical protein